MPDVQNYSIALFQFKTAFKTKISSQLCTSSKKSQRKKSSKRNSFLKQKTDDLRASDDSDYDFDDEETRGAMMLATRKLDAGTPSSADMTRSCMSVTVDSMR